MKKNRKFKIIVFLFIGIMVVSILGYRIVLHVGFIDALYMTAITISTVGYGEVGVMTPQAKLFSVFVIFSSLFIVGYGVTSLISTLFEGEFKIVWRKRRMEQKMREMKDHFIVCGAGDVGHTVIKNLKEYKTDFVVIDENEKIIEELQKEGFMAILGDASNEDILTKAKISDAKGIVCTLPSDAENVFTTLTARQMNRSIYIVSKAIEATAHTKLKKAGADKTISPNEISGQRIAAYLVRPAIISFLDVMTRAGEITLDLEEVSVHVKSNVIGKNLQELKIPDRTGLIILALEHKGEATFRFNPSSNEILKEDDIMIVLGTKEQVGQLEQIVNQE